MKNLFSPWLANLQKPVGLALKAKPDHQFYMRHPQYREKVAEEYQALYPDWDISDSTIKEQNRITAEMLQKEPEDVQKALKREAERN